ncbi:MAG: ABC transporter permease [Candidatus Accumulibacter sp.]|nr:ABC transporter permease [Accumulibacter sp.]
MKSTRRRGWEIMRRALLALFLRELKTRFGKYQLGYAWAFIEPLGTIGVIFAVLKAFSGATYPGISLPVFLGVGAIINSLFVEITNRSIKAIEANSTLFNYRPIRPIDTVIARMLLETILHISVFVVLAGLFWFFGGEFEVNDFPTLFFVFLFLAIFACGIGIIYMLLTDAYSDADKVLPMLNRPLFFISGVFFSLKNIPSEYWSLFLWNPLFHAIELTRGAVASGYHVEGVSLSYLAMCSVGSLTFAMALYHRRERRLRLR